MELALTATGFALVYGTYFRFFNDGLPLQSTLIGCAASLLAFWLASQLKDGPADDADSVFFIERLCFGTGVSLLVHAFVTYVLFARRTPFLVVEGCLAASVASTAYRRWGPRVLPVAPRILFMGFDDLCQRITTVFNQPVVGIWGTSFVPAPSGVQMLGLETPFEDAVAMTRPTHIVVGLKSCESRIPADSLLRCRLNGIRITGAPDLYEKLFSRVCCERLQPVDLVLSSGLRGDSRTMAIQAVYNNVVGLAILLAVSPVMLLITAAILLTGGRGSALESSECAGFQYIPFRLQRFRTTHADGSRTAVGRLIRWLRLVNLPQLINVVRGDMALVGPRPVRSEFARYLSAQMPFYAYRFSVKPGFGGWAQMHLVGRTHPDTRLEIEYDLYYIKESSLWLDMEILLGRLFGARVKARVADQH